MTSLTCGKPSALLPNLPLTTWGRICDLYLVLRPIIGSWKDSRCICWVSNCFPLYSFPSTLPGWNKWSFLWWWSTWCVCVLLEMLLSIQTIATMWRCFLQHHSMNTRFCMVIVGNLKYHSFLTGALYFPRISALLIGHGVTMWQEEMQSLKDVHNRFSWIFANA